MLGEIASAIQRASGISHLVHGEGPPVGKAQRSSRSTGNATPPRATTRQLLVRLARGLVVFLALGYPVALLTIALMLGFVGERSWFTNLGLFAPRHPFLLPLPVLVVALLLVRRRRLLWSQLVALLIWLFPIMGFVISLPSLGFGESERLRVLSCNIAGNPDVDGEFARLLAGQKADLVLLQEVGFNPDGYRKVLAERLPHVEASIEFLIASRFPIVSTTDPGMVQVGDHQRSARYLEHALDTPVGPLRVFNVHPVSPRSAFYKFMAKGVRRRILDGEFASEYAVGSLKAYTLAREVQLADASLRASSSEAPTIVAGDFNTPSLSPLWRRYFGAFQDGFEEAGWGFGYTFPERTDWPAWLRLDRVLANDTFRFTSFRVLDSHYSDHRCVVAELVRDT